MKYYLILDNGIAANKAVHLETIAGLGKRKA